MVAYKADKAAGFVKTKVARIRIGDFFSCAADLDSGARLCFMGRSDYLKYRNAGGKSVATALTHPLRIKVANNRIEYSNTCLKEHIVIPVEEDVVTVYNAILYIVDGQWGEVLIGWPVLHALGATPEQSLVKLKGRKINMNNFDQELFGVPKASMVEVFWGLDTSTLEVLSNQTIVEPGWTSSDTLIAGAKGASFENKKYLQNDGVEVDFEFDEIGILEEPDTIDFRNSRDAILEEAKSHGCLQVERLKSILDETQEIFAMNFEDCRISKMQPMEPQLMQGAQPSSSRPRRMSNDQLAFLKDHINKMLQLGMVKRAENPVWGVPVFVVPKPHGGGWRMVADFREVNNRTLSSSLPMPLLEQLIESTASANFYASLDAMSGFNLLATTNNHLFTLVTPFGCYEMMVAPMGFKNSPAVFQDRICNQVLESIHGDFCINWIDDTLVFGATEDEFLSNLETVLHRYKNFNVKLALNKCHFFSKKILWCGRELCGGTWTFDPDHYKKILDAPTPETAVELADFLFAITWLQSSLIGILEAKALLTDFVNNVYQKREAKTRKKKHLVGVKLVDYGWEVQHQTAYEHLKKCVAEAVRLAVPDRMKQLCLFTDASLQGCSILVTQVIHGELEKKVRDQKHEIVFLTTHKWNDTEERWHVSCQEAYPIVFSIQRLDYLFAGRSIRIFTDHKNLAHIFEPSRETPKTTLARLQRWALLIQAQTYKIEHIEGKDNVVADLFSRWGVAQRREVNAFPAKLALKQLASFNQPGPKSKPVDPDAKRRSKLFFLEEGNQQDVEGFVLPKTNELEVELQKPSVDEKLSQDSYFDDLENRLSFFVKEPERGVQLPTKEEVSRAQQLQAQSRPVHAEINSEGLLVVDGKVWIPISLMRTIIVTAHAAYGHPGATTLAKTIQSRYYCPQVLEYCKELSARCIHCTGEYTPKLLRRRWGEQFFSRYRNGILHMDFLYLRKKEYLLCIRDDFTGKTELIYCDSADAMAAADGLLWWRARFGLRRDTLIVTDGGSHFANSLMKDLIAKMRIKHHITIAYSPWSNGKAERVNREILKLFRVTLSELNLGTHKWKSIISVIQFKLNNIPRKSLGDRTADQVFLVGAGDGVNIDLAADEEDYEIMQINLTSKDFENVFADLVNALDVMHKEVVSLKDMLRDQRLMKTDQRLGIDNIQFAIGDWVLVSRAVKRKDKLSLQWIGPFQVADTVNDWAYSVRSLVNGKTKIVHVRRLRFYDNRYWNVTEDVVHKVIRDTNGFEIEKIHSTRWNESENRFELECAWWGFDEDYTTWEPYDRVEESNSDLLDRFLLKAKPSDDVTILKKKRGLI